MKIAEVRQKSTEELRDHIKKIHEEHFNLRFRRVTDVIENPQALRDLRRDLARIHTVIRQREMEEAAKGPAAPASAPAPAAEAKPEEKAAKAPEPKSGKKTAAKPKAKAAGKKKATSGH